jgi:hypothetical protein
MYDTLFTQAGSVAAVLTTKCSSPVAQDAHVSAAECWHKLPQTQLPVCTHAVAAQPSYSQQLTSIWRTVSKKTSSNQSNVMPIW